MAATLYILLRTDGRYGVYLSDDSGRSRVSDAVATRRSDLEPVLAAEAAVRGMSPYYVGSELRYGA